MSACAWPYQPPAGIRPDVHARFVAVIQRATEKVALPPAIWADDPDGPDEPGETDAS